jgi:hypothetical protein
MSISELKHVGFVGRILDSSSPDYDASLTRANVAAQRKAKFIAFPTTTEDVQAAIKFARKLVSATESGRASSNRFVDQIWRLRSNVVATISLLRVVLRVVSLSI